MVGEDVARRKFARAFIFPPSASQDVGKSCNRTCEKWLAKVGSLVSTTSLTWCVLGGTGVRKSNRSLFLNELIQDMCEWQMDFDYEMAALQSVLRKCWVKATHHACCKTPSKGSVADESSGASRKQSRVAELASQRQVLSLDEISIGNAMLLAVSTCTSRFFCSLRLYRNMRSVVPGHSELFTLYLPEMTGS